MSVSLRKVGGFLVVSLVAALAGCGSPPPPPPPPPPRIVIPTPPRPLPPAGAPETLAIPSVGPDGLFVSVNRNITPAQTVWNLRSAWNVAALNCNDPRHVDLIPAYRAFLKSFAKPLAATNRKVDAEFKGKYGADFIRSRELYMTAVYNHYALPPTIGSFCDAVLAVSRDAAGVKPAELDAFAARSLPSIEIVFDDFYRKYALYRAQLAEWKARYEPQQAPIIIPAYQPAANTYGPQPQAYGSR